MKIPPTGIALPAGVASGRRAGVARPGGRRYDDRRLLDLGLDLRLLFRTPGQYTIRVAGAESPVVHIGPSVFTDAADAGQIPTTELKANSEGYPPDLQTLVDGVSVANDATGRKLKFLRRVPKDPVTGEFAKAISGYSNSTGYAVFNGLMLLGFDPSVVMYLPYNSHIFCALE